MTAVCIAASLCLLGRSSTDPGRNAEVRGTSGTIRQTQVAYLPEGDRRSLPVPAGSTVLLKDATQIPIKNPSLDELVQSVAQIRTSLQELAAMASRDRGREADADAERARIAQAMGSLERNLAHLRRAVEAIKTTATQAPKPETKRTAAQPGAGSQAAMAGAEVAQLTATLMSLTETIVQLRREMESLKTDAGSLHKKLDEVTEYAAKIDQSLGLIDAKNNNVELVKARSAHLQAAGASR